jgi:hypothetical protein
MGGGGGGGLGAGLACSFSPQPASPAIIAAIHTACTAFVSLAIFRSLSLNSMNRLKFAVRAYVTTRIAPKFAA